jgi:hypothetical protein
MGRRIVHHVFRKTMKVLRINLARVQPPPGPEADVCGGGKDNSCFAGWGEPCSDILL